MHTNISTILLFLAGTFGLMSGVFHFISMGAFWLYLRPKLRGENYWAGIFALRRGVELKELEALRDGKTQTWVSIVRTLDTLVIILAIGFGILFAIYLYIE